MRNERLPTLHEHRLTGELPPEKAMRCGEFIPFTEGEVAGFLAHSVYQFLHGDAVSDTIAIPLISSPSIEHEARRQLFDMILGSCEGRA